MSIVERAIKQFSGVVDGTQIDWAKWMSPDEKSRVVPAEALAERGKARMLLGSDAEPGLTLPWGKTNGKVLIRAGKLCVWTGWSRHGKTQMLKNVMLHAIASGEKCLVASMEEEVIEVWADMARQACDSPDPSPSILNKFVAFVRGKLWLYDQQGQVEPKKLLALCRYAASELGVTQIMVDSLMLLAVGRDDYEAQARFVSELKSVTKDTGCTVHLVAHMRKRDGKGDEAPGSMHDISGGHEIGSIADYVFVCWRDINQKNTDGHGTILKVEKQRGRVNWIGTVGLHFHDRSRQFIEGNQATQYLADSGDQPL